MKKAFSNRGFTLIELIVSLILVSIMMMGILSINTVLQNNNVDYGQKYLVKSATQNTLNHIINNAFLAIGNNGTDPNGNTEEGIVTGLAGTGDPNSFCIHQDIPLASPLDTTVVNDPASTPPNYTNSRWLCYTWTGSPAYQIAYCKMAYNYNASGNRRGAASCAGAPIANQQFLGQAFSITPTINGAATAPTMNLATGIFSISIQNCLNDSANTCSATGTSGDPANNPEVTLSASVTPPQNSI